MFHHVETGVPVCYIAVGTVCLPLILKRLQHPAPCMEGRNAGAVSDREHAAALAAHHLEQRLIQHGFGRTVQCAGGFVGKNPAGLFQQGARNGNALLLAT